MPDVAMDRRRIAVVAVVAVAAIDFRQTHAHRHVVAELELHHNAATNHRLRGHAINLFGLGANELDAATGDDRSLEPMSSW